ncbi:MAG: MGMT family protein [Lachnospiraceae bacterium]|nr:MGMT family protein [Lachnospiraceae bacterium]
MIDTKWWNAVITNDRNHDGKLVGYAGGIDRKQYLLEMEAIQ